MTELDLRSLVPEVAWPPTPDIASRLVLEPRRRRGALVAALAAAALAAAFAVPQSRSAILRFFHLGGVTIERVDTLPPAQERPLSAGLGEPVGDAEAERTLNGPFVPADHGTLYERDGIVSTLLAGPVLLSEFGAPEFLKKFAVSTHVEWVEVAPGIQGIWLSGAPHVVFFPDASPRLAGNTLVWADNRRTFRIEGPALDKQSALRLARRILGTASS